MSISICTLYVFSMCFFGASMLCANSPSSVIIIIPVVSLSNLPAGNNPFLMYCSGTKSNTVFAVLSSVADMYPCGLLSTRYMCFFISNLFSSIYIVSCCSSNFCSGLFTISSFTLTFF